MSSLPPQLDRLAFKKLTRVRKGCDRTAAAEGSCSGSHGGAHALIEVETALSARRLEGGLEWLVEP
jgi:hypothetical protein